MTNKIAENNEVKRFLTNHKFDMPDLFRTYDYGGDYYVDGFPKRFALEQRILKAAKQNSFDKEDLLKIAEWGNIRNIKPVEAIDRPIKIPLYNNGEPVSWLRGAPEKIIGDAVKIPGFRATFSSKLLHFSVPQIFGALDTWLVRTFGEGDPVHQRYKFLKLRGTYQKKGGWSIPIPKSLWPEEFGTWIRILNYIAEQLNEEKILCPHPSKFLKEGLRKDGIWYPADVESALFCYAYEGRGVKIIRALGHENKAYVD
jgi:hypothetical protein